MTLVVAFWPSYTAWALARMKGAQRWTLVASRGRASQSSSERREPAELFLAPEAWDDWGKTKSALSPRLDTELPPEARAPCPSAIMVTTAAMPMVIPTTVSPARSLLRRTMRRAMKNEDR